MNALSLRRTRFRPISALLLAAFLVLCATACSKPGENAAPAGNQSPTYEKFMPAESFYRYYRDKAGNTIVIDAAGKTIDQSDYLIDIQNNLSYDRFLTRSYKSPDDETPTLELITPGGTQTIAEDVSASRLSSSGNAAVYLSDFDGRSGTLTYCNLETMEKTVLTDRAYAELQISDDGYSIACPLSISPDGRTVGFLTDRGWALPTGTIQTIGSEPQTLEDGCLPILVSNNGETVYCLKTADREGTDASFCVLAGGVLTELVSNLDPSDKPLIQLSSDCQELMISANDKTVLYRTGKGIQEIPGGLHFMLSPNFQSAYTFGSQDLCGHSFTIYNRGLCGGLTDAFYQTRSNEKGPIFYLNHEAELEPLSLSVEIKSFQPSLDGRKILILDKSSALWLGDASSGELTLEQLSTFVFDFYADETFQYAYCVDLDDNLQKIKTEAGAKPSRVVKGLDALRIVVQRGTGLVYVIADQDGDGAFSVYSIDPQERSPKPVKIDHSDNLLPSQFLSIADSISFVSNFDDVSQTGDLYFIVEEAPPVKAATISYN